jgi:HK97 gp10 family phage protein
MINFETKLTGDLSAQIDRFERKVQDEVLMSGVAAMAKVMYDEARFNAEKHRKSGKLQDAIYRVFSPEKSSYATKTYRISWNKSKAPHGHLIEFGTSRAPAYPFIRPAFDRINEAIKAGQARMAERMAGLGTES